MMGSLTASTDVMKMKLPSERQTLTMQPKIGLRRSINHVQIIQLAALIQETITMVKTGEDALEINQMYASTLQVSFS